LLTKTLKKAYSYILVVRLKIRMKVEFLMCAVYIVRRKTLKLSSDVKVI